MKKLMLTLSVVATAASLFAAPGGGRGCGGGGGCRPCRPACRPSPGHCHPHHCGGDWWGRGGRNFWPGFIGGVVGGVVGNAVVAPACRETVVVQTTPTVVTTPVVVSQPAVTTPVTQTQTVWVEGCYVNSVQANGTVLRTWSPGHYETRTVVVQ